MWRRWRSAMAGMVSMPGDTYQEPALPVICVSHAPRRGLQAEGMGTSELRFDSAATVTYGGPWNVLSGEYPTRLSAFLVKRLASASPSMAATSGAQRGSQSAAPLAKALA